MARLSTSGYLFVFLWGAWLFALQGVVAGSELGGFTPDLGLVLLLALDARLTSGDARRVAVVLSLARAGFSADSAAAIVTGYLGVVGVTSALRSGMEIDGLFLRTLLACVFAGVLSGWWIACHQLALGARASLDPGALLPGALATGLVSLVIGPLLIGLPGFSSIRRRRRA